MLVYQRVTPKIISHPILSSDFVFLFLLGLMYISITTTIVVIVTRLIMIPEAR